MFSMNNVTTDTKTVEQIRQAFVAAISIGIPACRRDHQIDDLYVIVYGTAVNGRCVVQTTHNGTLYSANVRKNGLGPITASRA